MNLAIVCVKGRSPVLEDDARPDRNRRVHVTSEGPGFEVTADAGPLTFDGDGHLLSPRARVSTITRDVPRALV